MAEEEAAPMDTEYVNSLQNGTKHHTLRYCPIAMAQIGQKHPTRLGGARCFRVLLFVQFLALCSCCCCLLRFLAVWMMFLARWHFVTIIYYWQSRGSGRRGRTGRPCSYDQGGGTQDRESSWSISPRVR
jgi:uncharacterized membrane protein YgcG